MTMYKNIKRFKVYICMMTFMIIASVLSFVLCEKVEAGTYETKYQEFINDDRWKNGINWGAEQGPKLSGWSSKGCCAYCADFEKYVYGNQGWKGTPFYSISDIKTGDILHVSPEHWFVVLSRNGNSLYTAEGNCGSKVVVSSSRYTISGNSIQYQSKEGPASYSLSVGYHYNAGNIIPPVTTGWSNKTENVTGTNAVLGITYNAGSSKYFGYVGLYVNGQYACGYEPGKTASSYTFSFDLNKDAGITLQSGQKYTYKFYVNTMSGDTFGDEYSFTTPRSDNEKPVITDAKVIDKDSTGYTVQCKVTDNVGVDRVQCPTWTKEGDQDDIAKDWGTNSAVKATSKGNGIYEFRVKISDHNNEYGYYHTHIYAYDKSGNQSDCVALNYNNVLMGDMVNIGNDIYAWIKTCDGGYCFNKYTHNYQSDSLENVYLEVLTKLADTCPYSHFVYHFIKNDEVYEMFFGTSSLGKCLILDDGTGKGYLIAQYGTNKIWGYDDEKKEVKLMNYSQGNENQYIQFEDIIKRSRSYIIHDSYVEYDGNDHSLELVGDYYDTIYYRTSEQSEWDTKIPTRKDVGTTKIYYKIVSPCYYDTYRMAELTVTNNENCKINILDYGLTSMFECQHARGMVISPEVSSTTTFTSYKIITSVIKNGRLITDEKEYGPITIESGSASARKAVLVDPINFENADGEYTTTISLTSVTGEKYQRTLQYNFKYYNEDVVKRIKVGENFAISTDVTNDQDALERVYACPDEYNSGRVDIQKNEDAGNYSITGIETGRVYLYCYRYISSGRTKMIIVDIIDNNSNDTHTHDYLENITKQPTCTEKGTKEFICSCGDSYTEDIPAKGHNMEDTVVAPTATEDGYTLHKCKNEGCNYEYKDNIIPHETTDETHQHNYTETTTKDPTCLEAGVKTYTCECGASYTEGISAVGHNYVSEIVDPTHESMGYTLHTCSVCGDSYKDNYTEYKENENSPIVGPETNPVVDPSVNPENSSEKPNDSTTHNQSDTTNNSSGSNAGEKPSEVSNNNVGQNQNDNTTNTNSDNGNVSNGEKITLSAMTVTNGTPSTNQVKFNWDADSNATGFIIEYSTNSDLSDTKSGVWDKNFFGSYVLGDLAENTTYYYRVRSFKGDGDAREYSEWTTIASFTTKAKTVTTESSTTSSTTVKAPKIKIKSFKNNKKGKAVVKWKMNFDVDGYQVSVSKKKSFSGAKKKNVNAYTNSITVSGLKKGKTYYAKVRSYVKDDYGNKVYGKWSKVKKVKIRK